MVNPGGTGRPRLVISARLAPLPPSSSIWLLSLSVKPYTYLAIGFPVCVLRVGRSQSRGVELGEAEALAEEVTRSASTSMPCRDVVPVAGSPAGGGYASAKATQRLIAGYAQDEARRAGLGITVTAG